MKIKSIAATISAIALCIAAQPFAHASGVDDHKPRHGGVLTEGKAFDAELVVKADLITIYVSDHGKSLMSNGMKARVTILDGGVKSEAELTPSGEDRLEAKGKFPTAKGTKFVAAITPPGKNASSFRFEIK
jgi:hypothetical protein